MIWKNYGFVANFISISSTFGIGYFIYNELKVQENLSLKIEEGDQIYELMDKIKNRKGKKETEVYKLKPLKSNNNNIEPDI